MAGLVIKAQATEVSVKRHTAISFVTTLAAVAGLALVWGPADTPAQSANRGQYGKALELIEQGEANRAADMLRDLADADAGAVSHVASQVLDQIRGAYRQRQKFWLDRKVGDFVVLVDDRRSFVEAVRGWDEKAFYPVLFDDGWYSTLFIRAFKPAHIVTFQARDAGELTDEQFDQAVESIDRPNAGEPAPGLVVIDPDGPHRLAGLALAAGRGQPVAMIPAKHPLHAHVSPNDIEPLNRKIMAAAHRTGLLSADQQTAVTLAGEYPYRYRSDDKKNQLMAVDDRLGRTSDGSRLAVVGRLHGAREQAMYQAMCAMFLHIDRTLLFDDYTNRSGRGFEQYRFGEARKIIAKRMPVAHVTDDLVTADNFIKLTTRGEPFDMVWINSSGHDDHWDLQDGRWGPDEFPMGLPRVFYVVHSHSAGRPHNPDTLAGRALVGGAYWYFGAVNEPYLNGFAPPTGIAVKATAGTPLAFAARQAPGMPFYRPWKLMLVGDPLTTIREEPAERIDPNLADRFADLAQGRHEKRPADIAERSYSSLAADAVEQLAGEANDLKPGELAFACHALHRAGQTRPMAEVPVEAAARHPVATVLVRQAVRDQFKRQVGSDPDGAATTLERLLTLGGKREQLLGEIRTWLAAVAKRSPDGQARAQLEQMRNRLQADLPRESKRAVDQALKAGQPGS